MKRKYIIFLILPLIISLILGNFIFYNYLKNHSRTEFKSISIELTNQISSYYNFWIEDQKRILKQITTNEKIINACLDPTNDNKINLAENFLEELNKDFHYNESMPIAIPLDKPITRIKNGKTYKIQNGTFFMDSVDGKLLGKGGINYSYIKEILNGKDYYISEIYPSILRENPIFVISYPIKHNSKIIGIAFLSPKMQYFTKLFVDSVKIDNSGYMIIVDETGNIIAHPERSYILTKDKKILSIGKDVVNTIENGSKLFQKNYFDEKKLYYGTKIKTKNPNFEKSIYLVFTQPIKDIYDEANKIIIPTIIISTSSAILLIIIILFISYINHEKLKKEQLVKMNYTLEKQVSERTKKLKKMAITDGLTNLFNHQYSHKVLKEIINKSKLKNRKMSFFICDLDDFKSVNDNYGHQIGDQVLIEISSLIKSKVRRTDIVGRYGGEEFLVVLPSSNLENSIKIAENIRKSIYEDVFSEKKLKITISIGLVEFKSNESDIELIARADKLLYKAKENGKNRIET